MSLTAITPIGVLSMRYLDRDGFASLVVSLRERGYTVIGPTVRDGAIVLDEIDSPDDMPRGVREEHAPGSYRLSQTDDPYLFRWAHGPDAGKRFLFPPRETIETAHRSDDGRVEVTPMPLPEIRYAFIGLRACDLAAIDVQDRVFMVADPAYRARREHSFTVGVNCELPGATCFCSSMGTGPRCSSGFDLALTEHDDGFTVDIGTPAGAEVLDELHARKATDDERGASHSITADAIERMGRTVQADGLPALLARNREHPRWDDVAARCLSCTNCTMVCPTCFCHDLGQEVSLDGADAVKTREWASCFSEEFTHMSFGEVRASTRSRYRQWLTHKFSSWVDQFGTSGCVGCGRCVTWCPAGIDVTEEIAVIRATDGEVRLDEGVIA